MPEVAVIKFTARWCGPCQACSPEYKALGEEFKGVIFHEVDVDNDPQDASGAYYVRSLPTFIVLQDNLEVARVVGGGKMSSVRQELQKLTGAAAPPENPLEALGLEQC